MEDANKIRTTQQHEALVNLCRYKNLVANWGTGVGKSRVFIRAVNAMEKRGYTRFLLLVAEKAHKMNWRCEFVKVLGTERGNELLDKVVIECYASLKKYANTEWDFVCADEAHHLRSGLRMNMISTLKSNYMLCLSATFSDKGDADDLICTLEQTFGEFKWMKYNLQDAINDGILPEPVIYIHQLEFDSSTHNRNVEISWGTPWYQRKFKTTAKEFQNDSKTLLDIEKFPFMMLTVTECSELQEAILMNIQIKQREAFWKRTCADYYEAERKGLRGKELSDLVKQMTFAKNQYLQSGGIRKKFLGQCKTEYARELLESLSDKKYICFCADIEQVNELGGENVIHSQKKNNIDVINAFNNDEIQSIFAVGMIKEGQNLNNIQAGIVIQLGGKERDFVQQFGRAMRSESPEQHIIIMSSQKDYDYLNTAIEHINPRFVKTIYATRHPSSGTEAPQSLATGAHA